MAPANDHGLEVLKKSGEEVIPGSKANYYLKVGGIGGLALASEATLQSVLNAVDGLEGFTDGIEGLLTTIRDNADQLEGFTDGIEGLLTTIRDNADQLEGYLDGVEGLLTNITGEFRSTTAVITSVAASAASTTLLAANANRKGFILHNDSAQPCKVALGVAASATVFSFIVPANASIKETQPHYTGVVNGIWGAAVGNMRITELT